MYMFFAPKPAIFSVVGAPFVCVWITNVPVSPVSEAGTGTPGQVGAVADALALQIVEFPEPEPGPEDGVPYGGGVTN